MISRTAIWIAPVLALAGVVCIANFASAQDTNQDSQRVADETPGQAFPLFAEFAANWSDEAWVPREARRFPQHIRDLEDSGWQQRMVALHEVVSAGEPAVPFLLDKLKSGQTHERILAAQALGYLAKHVPAEPLLEALRNDDDAAVQLYAADALGMRGDAEVASRWEDFAGEIRNRDVRRHMAYAEERAGAAVEDSIVNSLANWNPETMNSAEVGKPAPQFELSTVNGETIKLADFQGEKNVVLVFIYGDT